MTTPRVWQERHPHRLPDELWQATVTRVRGEFQEMPGMRVTPQEAASLLGLNGPVAGWVLGRLESDGFLSRTPQGEYVRRNTRP